MRSILSELEDQLKPDHTALLVVDMQNDFCAEGGYLHRTRGLDMSPNKVIADNINRLVDLARETGMTVVWIVAIYDHKYLSDSHLAKIQHRSNEGVLCAEGTWGADFYEMSPGDGEIVIQKHRFSAFHGTRLDDYLRGHGVKTLVVTGVATNICVDSTIRDGFFNGYYIVVPEECVGGEQTLHDATLKTVDYAIGTVTSGDEIIKLVGANALAAQ
ncbi:MAG: isochorismatase family cysteine hydrolase [Rhodospirillales bacterium]|jgi:ureidoacrylate peracid hydrolase|nr:isochorismatase [Rhodospirillaceae bacterium]MDP6427794.1 isochorismatase family cysteine hydrolase [Rhodospirillales bacterium]MDP6644572.1 isochorismatase family cysteine hydrolase [Rhodospirillales bacterium]MDP6840294.1 isochorismatase family cysteine hydrolase [Rhodospirillales bacterium]|tara:strand:- start:43 stop:687 length:645 start_codon:yes stop_codon:yes gene_type:complete